MPMCSSTAPTRLQYAGRQDSRGWRRRCQHILHSTFLLLSTEALGLYPQQEFSKLQSCRAIRQRQHRQPDSYDSSSSAVIDALCIYITFNSCWCRLSGLKCDVVAPDLQFTLSRSFKSSGCSSSIPVKWLFSSGDQIPLSSASALPVCSSRLFTLYSWHCHTVPQLREEN